MRYLYQGSQCERRFKVLIRMTRIKSDAVIEALHDYLVKGRSDSLAATLNDVHKSNFNRALARVEFMAAAVEEVKEIDYSTTGRSNESQTKK